MNENNCLDNEFNNRVKGVIKEGRAKAYRDLQSEMLFAYWNIGKKIVEKQGGESQMEYGDGVIKELASLMITDYGETFNERNLRWMRQFYLLFPKWDSVSTKLSWNHYMRLMRIEDEGARKFYFKQAVEGNWSYKELESQINSFSYERYLAGKKEKESK